MITKILVLITFLLSLSSCYKTPTRGLKFKVGDCISAEGKESWAKPNYIITAVGTEHYRVRWIWNGKVTDSESSQHFVFEDGYEKIDCKGAAL